MITAINFSPDFFQNKYPYLILFRPAKGPFLFILVIGKQVIYNYLSWLPVNPDFDRIASSIIDVLSQKNVLDSLWVFSDRAQA
jgi:hypothetical protein